MREGVVDVYTAEGALVADSLPVSWWLRRRLDACANPGRHFCAVNTCESNGVRRAGAAAEPSLFCRLISGKFVIKPRCVENAENFSQGLAAFKAGTSSWGTAKWGYLDKEG